MTQEERLTFLLDYLLRERQEKFDVPADPQGRRQLLRALMNVRMPAPVSDEFLGVQDAYLQEETRRKGITDLQELEPVEPGIYLWQGDITTLRCDAIVNAANSQMLGCFVPCHGCIDNAIHSFAGVQLRLACQQLMQRQGHEEGTGEAKITPRLQPSLPLCAAYGGADHHRPGHRAGLPAAGKLLPLLPGAGRTQRLQERGLLLHFHRRVSFSKPAGGADCRRDGAGLQTRTDKPHGGDLQCFSGPGPCHLQTATGISSTD